MFMLNNQMVLFSFHSPNLINLRFNRPRFPWRVLNSTKQRNWSLNMGNWILYIHGFLQVDALEQWLQVNVPWRPYLCDSGNKHPRHQLITPIHMLHGAGIFTYKTWWFCSGKFWVNIPYMEHMGKKMPKRWKLGKYTEETSLSSNMLETRLGIFLGVVETCDEIWICTKHGQQILFWGFGVVSEWGYAKKMQF